MVKDPFEAHLNDPDTNQREFAARLARVDAKQWQTTLVHDELLGKVMRQTVELDPASSSSTTTSWNRLDAEESSFVIKQRLLQRWQEMHAATDEPRSSFSPLQHKLLSMFSTYGDLLYTGRSHDQASEIREIYALHALNHVLKTRDRVLKNTEKLKRGSDEGKTAMEIRDQGYTRPKVLILVPFRNAALQVIETLIDLSGTTQQENKKRLRKEFSVDEDEDNSADLKKPLDYQQTFEGNIDDCFRVGIKFSRKTMKLYSEFYSSDVLVASPLGLRMIIGSKGEKDRDFDFLSSIEMVIVDQANVLAMQNWDHVRHVFDHLNLIPKEFHDCDFSRVRHWYLDGRAKNIRQSLIFGSFPTPELNSLYNGSCNNVAGKFKTKQEYMGTIHDVIPNVQHVFSRLDCESITEADDARFRYFTEKTFPALRQSILLQSHNCIVVPSYFDFLRLKQWFEEKELSFVALSEYASDGDISRGRSDFFHGNKQYMLITERFHFFRRYRLRGVHHLVFYALPEHAHFYAEWINMISSEASVGGASAGGVNKKDAAAVALETTATITSLYTKYDLLKLERIVGSKRVGRMVQGEKSVFAFA